MDQATATPSHDVKGGRSSPVSNKHRSRRKNNEAEEDPSKRRCVSTACIACRKRKSKCDGNLPACAACLQVYNTECVYDPNSDHRRKGVYKNDLDNFKTRNSTLHTLIHALLNSDEDEAFDLVRELRSCDSLDAVAERILAERTSMADNDTRQVGPVIKEEDDSPIKPSLETELYGKMRELQLSDGTVRYIGGTSNLLHLDAEDGISDPDDDDQQENAVTSWTTVTDDASLILHLLNMYFTWHYSFFTTLSKKLFLRDFMLGHPLSTRRKTHYCTPLLVNAMLALGCHFTSNTGARENPDDSATAGDHFFKEAKRLIMVNDEHEHPRLATVQALALMSVREAGCGREAKGWVYSGISFRMALDMGLPIDLTASKHLGNEEEIDVRRITLWGCYLFDSAWSLYLGRQPQLPTAMISVAKFDVFPDEDSSQWSPYTDSGFSHSHTQPSRTRAVALQIVRLCEISKDMMKNFYDPTNYGKSRSKATEIKMLSDIHVRLEAWKKALEPSFQPKEGSLPSVLTMAMFAEVIYIHLFRPFLRYTQATSPLPANVNPRKQCSHAATTISKLLRLYKRSYGLRQITNIVVYILHNACTIHLLNLSTDDKNAKRDIVHGVKHLEEMAEGWLGARRTLAILSTLARKWKVDLPEEAAAVLARTDKKFGTYSSDASSPVVLQRPIEPAMNPAQFHGQQTMPASTSQDLNTTFPIAHITTPASRSINAVASTSATADQYGQPVHDLNHLIRQQHSILGAPIAPTAATPQNQSPIFQNQSIDSQKTASPSDMFTGVDQLIFRDQAQFASGFNNWTGLGLDVNIDPSTWANGAIGLDGTTGMPMQNVQAVQGNAYMPNENMYPMQAMQPGDEWYQNMAYNENGWYQ